MTANEQRPGSRRRRLSADEHALWHGVIRSVVPLKRRRVSSDPAPGLPLGRSSKAATGPHATPVPSRATPAIKKAPVAKLAPALVPLDRRLKQRLARGAETIDARIDLHGRTQSEAHGALLRFLQRAQAGGARIVLVITGKGSGANDFASARGVLKRQVPLWLALPEFRALVLGVEDAHVGHGGEGALYVRVRRRR